MVIPTTLHHIWLGPRPVPTEWVAAWIAMHPGWDVKVWREPDLDTLPMRNRALYRRLLDAGVWHGAADIARLELLYDAGGVYVDIDSKPLRTFEGAPFMDADVFAAYEPPNPHLPGRVANGTIGAKPQSEAIDTARQLAGGMYVVDPPWATIGAPALTAALLVHERCCDVRVLPARTFYRTDWKGHPVPGSETSYVEHFWATTNHAYPARAVVLVPRRAGDPTRDASWAWCRRIWEAQGWPIFEGHHDEPGLFNASKARNAAAQAAGDWDVAIFADADTVPWNWKPVKDAVQIAAKTGRFIRPFSSYFMLDEDASRSFMGTGVLPKRGMRRLGESAYGGIHVVSRRLWDKSGGYDERFLGWGSEDAAFEFACTVLGGFARLPGEVYHLWHPMQPRDPSTPQFQANIALGARYRAATKSSLPRLMAERTGGIVPFPGAALVILTNGRREWIGRTLASIEKHVEGIRSRLIVDDSGDPEYVAWLRESFPGVRVDGHRHMGHGRAVHRALITAANLRTEWAFVCEDDMEFTEDIDLPAMAGVLDGDPNIVQMVVRRQAWFPAEVEAGGMIERFDPALFTDATDGTHRWIEHRQFYSMNPHLVRTDFLATHPWPPTPNSEHRFSVRLFRDKALRSALWGRRDDPPKVQHIGIERTGDGY